jgi:hypothetical protein
MDIAFQRDEFWFVEFSSELSGSVTTVGDIAGEACSLAQNESF